MSRDKQIEEMAKELSKVQTVGLVITESQMDSRVAYSREIKNKIVAEALHNAGYRKASEVAREIFEEIRTQMREKISINEGMAKTFSYDADFYKGRVDAYIDAINVLAELKKKYESEGDK